MATLKSKKYVGKKTVVELTIKNSIYYTPNGIISHNCNECKRVHLMPDGITPKVFKLSEVSAQYHKKGENIPSYAGLHPHCRCSLVMLPQNYGFKKGKISYMTDGYDEYKTQRSEDDINE